MLIVRVDDNNYDNVDDHDKVNAGRAARINRLDP